MKINMQTTKVYSQKILDSISQWLMRLPARELKHELSTVREQNQTLKLELQAVNSRLEEISKQEAKSLAEVQKRMERFEAECDTARIQLQDIHSNHDALDGRLETLTGKLLEQRTSYQADIQKTQIQVHQQTNQVEQLQSSVSQALQRQDKTDGRLYALAGTLEKQLVNIQQEIHDARLRDRKQFNQLKIAMALTGCAFLVTTAASLAWIEDSRKNDQMLSDVSRNIRDIKILMDRQLSAAKHGHHEAVSIAIPDESLPAGDISESGGPSSEKAIHITVDTLTEQDALAVPEGHSGTPDLAGLPHESQHGAFGYYEMPAKEEMLVPVNPTPAASVPVWDSETLAMPKVEPDSITPREDLSGADELLETIARSLPFEAIPLSNDGVGLPVTSGSGDAFSTTPYLARREVKRDKEFVELIHGQDDVTTYVKSRYDIGKLLNLGATFIQKDTIEDFASSTDENNGFWNVKLSSSLLGPSLDAEIALSSIDSGTSENFWSSDHRMMKLGSSTTWHDFNFGTTYQSVGKDFEELTDETVTGHKKKDDSFDTDTETTELWSYRQLGNLGIKAYTSLGNTNQADDPDLPRFTTRKVGSSVNYIFSDWPQVGVTLNYATGTLDSSKEPDGFESVSADVRDIASSLYYTGDAWSGSLTAENATGKASDANVTEVKSYYADASYYPIDTFSVSPSFSYARVKYPELNATTDTQSSSLTFNYQPKPNGLSYTLYGEHSTEENTAWAVDNSYLYTSLGVNWDAGEKKSLFKHWSIELFYDQYRDNVYSDSNTGGPGIMLKLRSSPRPARHFMNDLR
jgi:hypothetical protein